MRTFPKAVWIVIVLMLLGLAHPTLAENIVSAVGAGKAEVSLVGDGKTTVQTKLLFKNLTAEPLVLEMAANTVFECQGRQPVLVLQEKKINLGPKAAAQSTVQTMCLGSPSDQPAVAEPTVYTPLERSADGLKATGLLQNCAKLKEEGRFPALPLPPALQVRIISQMAYWADRGELDRETVRRQTLLQMGIEPSEATPEQEKEVDEGVGNIFEAVDLTRKTPREVR